MMTQLIRPDNINIVFDKYPPSAIGKYQLTLDKPYMAKKENNDLGLYSLVDNNGVVFNVSTFGAGHSNNEYWHII
jgi:hypothetical protein